MLEGIINKQLKDQIELLEKKNSSETTCLNLLKTNVETTESIY